MDILRKASHVVVAGKSGMGKSSYGERYIIGSHHDRVFIFDHQAEFFQRLHLLPCFSFDEMRERAQRERIISFDYATRYPGELELAFDHFCEEVFDLCQGVFEPAKMEVLMVCDEVQKCTTVNQTPQPLKTVMQTGRRYKLDSLLMTQQPNRIHNEMREQITELTLFRLNDENSLKFAAYMGVDVEAVAKLDPLHYLWFQTVTGESRTGEIDFKDVKTFQRDELTGRALR